MHSLFNLISNHSHLFNALPLGSGSGQSSRRRPGSQRVLLFQVRNDATISSSLLALLQASPSHEIYDGLAVTLSRYKREPQTSSTPPGPAVSGSWKCSTIRQFVLSGQGLCEQRVR